MSKCPPRNENQDDPFTTLENACGPLVHRIWPEEGGNGTLCEALREAGAGALYESLNRHLRLMDSTLPVVAVAGLVNAGKSSTVGTFLSAAGRARVLRGMGEDEATQRFVIWCPRSWERDDARRTSLEHALESVFGARLEFLSEDPASAHAQYNAHKGGSGQFNTPLIAFDEGLDVVQFAILDCPDVERKFPGATGEQTSRLRLDVLKKASAIASSILVVVNHGGAGKDDLELILRAVLEQMPGIPWWLLQNLCRTDYEPHQVLSHCASLAATLAARGVFVAFDYSHDADDWRQRTPVQLHSLRADDRKARQPAFYLAEDDAIRNPPNPVEEARLLANLPAQLDATGGVGERLCTMHAEKLDEEVQTTESAAADFCDASRRRARKLWETLLRVCKGGYMDAHGQLVVPLTPETAERLQKAFLKSAPLRARMAMWPAVGLRKVFGWVKSGSSYVQSRMMGLLGKPGTEKARRTVAKPESQRFVKEMIRESFALEEIPHTKDRLRIWDEILSRHQRHQPEQLSEKELEEALAEVWRQRSLAARALDLAAPALLLVLLAACALAPGDGGVTLSIVLAKLGIPTVSFTTGVFLAQQIIGFLSISEILIAVGATAALAPPSGFLLERLMRKKLALPALADLFACACDVFGLPRQIGDSPTVNIQGEDFPLPSSRADRQPVKWPLLKSSVWEFQPKGWRRLRAKVQEFAKKASTKTTPNVAAAP